MRYPGHIGHWIDGRASARARRFFVKYNPATGAPLGCVSRGAATDIASAVRGASAAAQAWRALSPLSRGDIIRAAALLMRERAEELARVVSLETGKSLKDARAETGVAIEMGFFVAGEGRRLYGKTTTSAVLHRRAMTLRAPVGLCGLIVAANTPIANVAWKAFPALLCGNTAVLKPSENAPYTALLFAQALRDAGVPAGVFQVVQGLGSEAGAALVAHPAVRLVSFTGSAPVGREIQHVAGARLAKVCLELGGKNALIVCDDADLDAAARDAALSAFSNAGQRCAAGSRIIVFSSVYERFKKKLLRLASQLSVGSGEKDDFGPVINEAALERILSAVLRAAREDGAKMLCGGKRLRGKKRARGYFMAPTLLERAPRGTDFAG